MGNQPHGTCVLREELPTNSPPALREGIEGRAVKACLLLLVKSVLFAPSYILPHKVGEGFGIFPGKRGLNGKSPPRHLCLTGRVTYKLPSRLCKSTHNLPSRLLERRSRLPFPKAGEDKGEAKEVIGNNLTMLNTLQSRYFVTFHNSSFPQNNF